MAILSDSEIQQRITDGGLIAGGDMTRASQCSYSFVAGVAFHPGRADAPINFPGEAIVKPGEMIWIRTLETVKMPDGLVGFWWQTNGLSRQGLMLVNMSMIEPGYEGDLACLFVNFGKSAIPINKETVIAKMVFSEVVGRVLSPIAYRSTRQAYDADLRALTINQPPSFLQISELAANVEAARASALQAIKDAEIASTADAKAVFDKQRNDSLDTFKANIPKAVLQSAAWAGAALALLTAATVGANWAEGKLFPNVKTVARSEAEQALGERLSVSATPDSAQSEQLSQQIKLLNARIAALEQKKK